MQRSYFTPGVFTFLRELDDNNDRAWWEQNKDRYVRVIREPAKAFIADFEPRLHNLSDHFLADTRTNGGSLMRPYRDMRFGHDQAPYKTNVGIQFRHEMGKDVHAPGFYLHIEPGRCFAGVGMWNPEPKVARVIRTAIHDDPDGWARATKEPPFTDVWVLDVGEDSRLKRLPREFDEDHPYTEDLRAKSFIATHRLTHREVTSPELDVELSTLFAAGSALNAFLCRAVGLPY